jgi:hypothetical protein
MVAWFYPLTEACSALDKQVHLNAKMKVLIEEAGFTELMEKVHNWPIGPWVEDPHGQAVGLAARRHLCWGLEGWTLRPLTHGQRWSQDQVQAHCATMRSEL